VLLAASLDARVTPRWKRPLPDHSELLNNIAQARGGSPVNVRIEPGENEIRNVLADDGKGFWPTSSALG